MVYNVKSEVKHQVISRYLETLAYGQALRAYARLEKFKPQRLEKLVKKEKKARALRAHERDLEKMRRINAAKAILSRLSAQEKSALRADILQEIAEFKFQKRDFSGHLTIRTPVLFDEFRWLDSSPDSSGLFYPARSLKDWLAWKQLGKLEAFLKII